MAVIQHVRNELLRVDLINRILCGCAVAEQNLCGLYDFRFRCIRRDKFVSHALTS